MRLDEWQKWLDAQFLDAAPVPEPAGEPPDSDGAVAQAAAAPAVEPTRFPPAPDPPGPSIPPESIANEPPGPPPATSDTVPRATPSPVAPPPTQSRAAEYDLAAGIEVPAIENYLPFLRGRRPGASEPDASDSTPAPLVEHAAAAEQAKGESAAAGPADSAILAAPAEADPVEKRPGRDEESAEQKPAESAPLPVEASAPAAPAAQTSQAAEVPRMAARQRPVAQAAPRIRQVRNVRPDEVVESSGPELLWSLVPRHLQVLIAMGSDEVARNSYRRSFKESRIALIERLLDPTLSLKDTARLLNVCPTTVRRYTNRGVLAHKRTSGDQRRFKLSDVLAFLEAQQGAGQGLPQQ